MAIEVAKTFSRKKSGSPIETYDPLFLFELTPICNELNKLGAIGITERKFARFCYKLQLFMEENISQGNQRNFVRLPASIFKDYRIPGALLELGKASILALTDFNFDNLDFIFHSFSDVMTLLISVENSLIESGFLRWPKIFFTNDLSKELVTELSAIAVSHRAVIVHSEIDASHIIHWDDEVDQLPKIFHEEYIRTLEVRPQLNGGIALVHWWYFPDSYDEWISCQDVDVSEIADTHSYLKELNQIRPKHVSCRYIKDLLLFHEWGNEYDYEIDFPKKFDLIHPPGDYHKSKSKRKFDELPKRLKKESIIIDNSIVTEKLMHEVKPPSLSLFDDPTNIVEINFENDSVIQSRTVTKQRNDEYVGIEDSQEIKKKKVISDQSFFMFSNKVDWLQIDSISPFEMKYLSDILYSHKSLSPSAEMIEKYLNIRNFILHQYQQSLATYISATDCRRKISGDASIIIRVHEFLESTGLINTNLSHRPNPKATQSSILSSFGGPDIQTFEMRKVINSQFFNNPTSNRWNKDLDQKLIDIVKHELKSGSTLPSVNWKIISSSLGCEFTDDNCEFRFIELTAESGENLFNDQVDQLYKKSLSLIDDYFVLRLAVIDEKCNLLGEVEKALALENERLALDKRDLQIQRGQMSYQQSRI